MEEIGKDILELLRGYTYEEKRSIIREIIKKNPIKKDKLVP